MLCWHLLYIRQRGRTLFCTWSLAMMRNLPIAGNSSSGRRLKCGPRSGLMSFQSGGWSKFKFNWSSQICTKPVMNWRKKFSSFCEIKNILHSYDEVVQCTGFIHWLKSGESWWQITGTGWFKTKLKNQGVALKSDHIYNNNIIHCSSLMVILIVLRLHWYVYRRRDHDTPNQQQQYHIKYTHSYGSDERQWRMTYATGVNISFKYINRNAENTRTQCTPFTPYIRQRHFHLQTLKL